MPMYMDIHNVDGATPTRQADGNWTATVTFPDLPLHSGEFVISAYLFDSHGMVVYDHWFQHIRFTFVSPSPLPGMVNLRHVWS